MDSRKITDVIVRALRIAAVVELTRNGLDTVATRFNVRSLSLIEDAKLSPKLTADFAA